MSEPILKNMVIKTDSLVRGIYATDASMYQMLPLGVATPRDQKELLAVIEECAKKKWPLVARGGGTSLTGQSINEAVILDLSKYLNRVLELNLEEGWVRVEPGVVCSQLNAFLKPHGVHFAPDPATENRANIGGMIANNSAGMRSSRYGMTIDHVLELDIALSTGEVLKLGQLDDAELEQKCAQDNREGRIYDGVCRLLQQHAELIQSRYPKVIRRSGGYALDALLGKPFNLAKLICGSEGTLGVVLEAKLKLSSLPKYSALCIAHFATLDSGLRAAEPVVKSGASAAELIDGIIVQQARNHPLTREICNQIIGEPAAILVIEVQGDDLAIVHQDTHRLVEALSSLSYATPVMTSAEDIAAVWQMRSSALGLMTTIKGSRKPTPYIEDAAVPPAVLADYVAEVLNVCRLHGQPVSLFGHASVGLMHIRPLHDLHQAADIEQMKQIQAEVFPLVVKYGGSWSGEHGDGIVRGAYNRQFFGEELYQAFHQIKALFDPDGRMNPGKVIDTPLMDSNLRYAAPIYQSSPIKTRFHYREQGEGGFVRAVEQCSGVGACRKATGVMCPSYMATRDELHSTRGRANTLRLAMSGQLGDDALTSPDVKSAMDLCLACTGCKAECPNGVDMAKLKAEVLQLQQEKNGIKLRTRFFSNLPRWGAWAAGPQASVINTLLGSKSVRRLVGGVLGLTPNRRLPRFATQRLSVWFSNRETVLATGKPQVLLFNDTYTEYFLPSVGRAAVECLEAVGYQVILATLGDSQRIAISLGLLDHAAAAGARLFQSLDSMLDSEIPVVVCEPSCATALKLDIPDLIDDEALSQRVSSKVIMFDAFLEKSLATGSMSLPLRGGSSASDPVEFLVHSHCHQKTLDGGGWTHKLLSRIPGATVKDSNAGCCGMAGSFGYELEHAELSRDIASQRLLPALTKTSKEALVISNGFSCRHQISELSSHRPMHVAEALRTFLS